MPDFTEGWASSLNEAPDPDVAFEVGQLDQSNGFAYANIADADGSPNDFTVTYDVDVSTMTPGVTATVELWYNDGPSSTNWSLAASDTYGYSGMGSNVFPDEQLVASGVSLEAGWDLRFEVTYDSPLGMAERASILLHSKNDTPAGVEYTSAGAPSAPGRPARRRRLIRALRLT